MKILNVVSVLFLAAGVLALSLNIGSGGVDRLRPRYPLAVYRGPGLTDLSELALRPGREYPVLDRKRVLVSKFYGIDKLKKYTTACQISRDPPLWCSEDIARLQVPGHPDRWLCRFMPSDSQFHLPFVLLCLSLACHCARRFLIAKRGRLLWFSATFLALHAAGLFAVFHFHGFFLNSNGNDPAQFFQIANEWLALDRRGAVPNNMGVAVLAFLPLQLIFRASDVDALLLPMHIACFSFCGLGSLLLIIAVAVRLRSRSLWLTASFAAFFPVFAWVWRQGGIWDPNFRGKTLLYLGPCDPFAMGIFNKSLLLSWNSIADNWAVLLILGGMLVMLSARPSVGKYIAMGLLFGFAISVRYGSFTVLPAVFFFDLVSLAGRKTRWRDAAIYYMVFAGFGFFGVFPQLLDNYLVNGSFFAPTVAKDLYEGGNVVTDLMGIGNLRRGTRFFCHVNFKVFLLFTFCLYLNRSWKVSMFLFLWFCAPLVFHASLNFYGHSAIRYLLLLFPAVYLAPGFLPRSAGRWQLVVFAGLYVLNMALVSPLSPVGAAFVPLPRWAHVILPLASGSLGLLLGVSSSFSWKASLAFFILMLLFATACWWLIPLGLIVFPPYLLVRHLFFSKR